MSSKPMIFTFLIRHLVDKNDRKRSLPGQRRQFLRSKSSPFFVIPLLVESVYYKSNSICSQVDFAERIFLKFDLNLVKPLE